MAGYLVPRQVLWPPPQATQKAQIANDPMQFCFHAIIYEKLMLYYAAVKVKAALQNEH